MRPLGRSLTAQRGQMELIIGAIIVGVLYVLDTEKLSKLSDAVQDFIDYVERQQG